MAVSLTLNLPAWVADVDESIVDGWACEGCCCEQCTCGSDPRPATWVLTCTQSCGCVHVRALCEPCRLMRLEFERWSAEVATETRCTTHDMPIDPPRSTCSPLKGTP